MSGRLHNRITRRRMVVATGAAVGAPLALAACGSEDELEARSEANDPDLLNAVLAEHLAVRELAAEPALAKAAGPAVGTLVKARLESIGQLTSFIEERDGTRTSDPAELEEAESQVEALARQLEASIEASLDAIGGLSSAAYRQAVHRFITEDAAALAAVRSVLGEEVVPDAFVFGPAESSEESG